MEVEALLAPLVSDVVVLTLAVLLRTVPLASPGLLSVLVVDTLAVLEMVVVAVSLGLACTTMRKAALVPEFSVPMLALNVVPELPTAGLVSAKLGPEVCMALTNVVPAGTVSVSE